MVFKSSFLAILTLALTVAATPVQVNQHLVSIPFAKRVNTTGSVNVVKNDLARIKALKNRAAPTVFEQDAVISAPVTNELVSYIASVGVGSPATACESNSPCECDLA